MDATGCTAAPGAWLATLCFTVQSVGGTGAQFAASLVEFTAPTTNICDQTTQWKYMPRSEGVWKYRTVNSPGCKYAYFAHRWDPEPNIWLQHSYDICGRVKNSVTGQEYTEWMCHTIYA